MEPTNARTQDPKIPIAPKAPINRIRSSLPVLRAAFLINVRCAFLKAVKLESRRGPQAHGTEAAMNVKISSGDVVMKLSLGAQSGRPRRKIVEQRSAIAKTIEKTVPTRFLFSCDSGRNLIRPTPSPSPEIIQMRFIADIVADASPTCLSVKRFAATAQKKKPSVLYSK